MRNDEVRKKNARLLREEMAHIKLEYFTNVSHELLTPLTILSCLTDEIEQTGKVENRVVSSLRDHILRMKKLIRQVLDFRKVEQKSMTLQVRYGDVASFLRNIAQTDFTLLAQKKDISFRCEVTPNEIYGYHDADKIEEMVFNLLSNAIKYTPADRAIGLDACTETGDGGKLLRIVVWDEGIGIAPEEQEKVFTRFYRTPKATGSESNGIGLALTRELALLHHGSLTLESAPGKGSRFTLLLPLDETAYRPEEIVQTTDDATDSMPSNTSQSDSALPVVMVVDDNTEITDSLERLLSGRYRILTAHSAAQARPMMDSRDIDLLVCDVMMPGIDGTAFCRMLKSDIATSHIPIIMLTAQDSEETRTTCYEAGADGYIAKPFDLRVLISRMDNLLLLYRQHRERFLHDTGADSAPLPYQDRDKAFLNELTNAVESHLQDSDFKLDSLVGELRLSKSTMNRKLKAMTGLTPMDFVRTIRLRAAARMLRAGGTTISEAAYAVGFSDPKYFAKCFKDEYGRTPSQFQEAARNGEDA